MNRLFLSPNQAMNLSDDLQEYAKLKDSSIRPIFSGFIIEFGDLPQSDITKDEDAFITMTPIPNHTEIGSADE